MRVTQRSFLPARSGPGGATITAVLGPTNTGKTHLAVERMCGHASGIMGFPLRLLAREVYERVVALKGEKHVALITGEEKIVPEGARYFLCTVEAMPTDRDVAFVAIDEGQVAADPERGHVFTDRLLHARGYAETMILGSETLKPLIRKLIPDAEIVTRPRFSTLSYAGPKKLSRLPRRTAIVAFTAAEVYAIAEMLRRQKGGAAVVMGSLSPRTRNAQVAMYQSGEVDYLVATDAIGMGLNMDIAHVAFAGLGKFDGRRQRRLSLSEMAQIAGRAGRYQKDGTFGTVQLGATESCAFAPEEIEGLEGHRFEPLTQLVWRNPAPDFGSLARLVTSLEARPTRPELLRSDDAIDLAVLKQLVGEPWVMERVRGPRGVARLWAACGLPDYRKTGAEAHARLVARLFRHISEGDCFLPEAWIASELAHLDRLSGDVETLADRIAGARTWTYIAHRPDWLANPAEWAMRTRGVEDRLSDALHGALTQRFVDRRTAVLLKDLGARGGEQPVEIDPDGSVAVGGEVIGRLDGFRFTADPLARAGEQRLLLAAAERYLVKEMSRRGAALIAAPDSDFALDFAGRMPPRLTWRGARVAKLRKGRDALGPRVELDRAVAVLAAEDRRRIQARLDAWIVSAVAGALGPLVRLTAARETLSPAARGLVVQLVENLGAMRREVADVQLAGLLKGDRQALARAGVRLGTAHVFLPVLLRPEPTRWRVALWAVAQDIADLPELPAPGRVSILADDAHPPGFLEVCGYWRIGEQAVRIDMADRLARQIHERRDGRTPFIPDPNWAASVGLGREGLARLMRALGCRLQLVDGNQLFAWSGKPRPQAMRARPGGQTLGALMPGAQKSRGDASDARTLAPSPFAILAGMKGR
ncbi:helicase-related protein [Sandarakinorhabdus sp.]|uniref:helicase-related protein n=1 Tax=Sandarakinorhabdus sp. TaxID=1916663 RepID=UPI00286D769E|nr:helicase-related protein [Sandarakinorhabdus sp.]